MYSSSQQQQMTPEQQQQLLFRQQQALLQQAALLQQQAALLQPTILPPSMSQIEPIPSGNLPPGFDASSCRSVYVGNIHPNVSEALLAEFFSSVGPLEGCKLIRKEKSSYGFIDYFNHRYAATAILSLNGRPIFGQPIKVNWAYTSGQREDTSGHFSIFVGDLSAEVTDAALYRAFSIYPSCSDGRVMWDQTTGRSRGFGFVSFKNKQEADQAITEMTGKRIGSRAIRCNWAAKNSTGNLGEDMAPAATHGEGSEETDKSERPENNPQFTTVYVGNLAHEVSQAELHQQFHAVGAGVIEEVRLQRDKGFGFVRYRTHEEAARAIQLANGRIICGKSVKCSWGNKPTPTSLASTPLPPPSLPPMQSLTSSLNQGYSAADIYAYQRQLGATQGGAGNLLTMSNQLPTQPNMGYVGAGAMAGSLPSTWTAPDGLQQQPHLY